MTEATDRNLLAEALALLQLRALRREGARDPVDIPRNPALEYDVKVDSNDVPYLTYRPAGGVLEVDGIEYRERDRHCERPVLSLHHDEFDASGARMDCRPPAPTERELDRWVRSEGIECRP